MGGLAAPHPACVQALGQLSDALERTQPEHTQLSMFRAFLGAAAECEAKRRCSRLLGSAQIRRGVLDILFR